MTPAGKLQDYLKQRVQQSGGQYRKVRWEGRRGCPDCFIWWEWPKLAFVEVKADRDVLSALQRREIERMRADGIPVFIVKTTADIDAMLDELKAQ